MFQAKFKDGIFANLIYVLMIVNHVPHVSVSSRQCVIFDIMYPWKLYGVRAINLVLGKNIYIYLPYCIS
jgi:hypothetical protein